MEGSSPEHRPQPDLFPDVPPAIPPVVVRIWKAAWLYYSKPGNLEPPTRQQLQDILFNSDNSDKPYSKATIDRARRHYPQFFPVWPIPRGMRPPWDEDATADDAPAAEWELIGRNQLTGQEQRLPVKVDDKGHLCIVISRIVSTIAAMFGAVSVLDSMDGNLDGAFDWCHLLLKLAEQHARL